MSIRKLTANDFGYIRKLPVQLAHPAANTLSPKKLRLMMCDSNVRLLVYVSEKGIVAFMALNFIPDSSNPVNFLVITHLALDRFSMSLGIAAEMEEHATNLARGSRSAAMLVRADKLSVVISRFYQGRGYILNGDSLMKKLSHV